MRSIGTDRRNQIEFADLALERIREDSGDRMQALARSVLATTVCRIAWAGIMAAPARRARENARDARPIEMVRTLLHTDRPGYAIVEITPSLVELAGEHADTFALRGCDSVRLAAARRLQDAAGQELRFACFDTRLQKSARVPGMLPVVQVPRLWRVGQSRGSETA